MSVLVFVGLVCIFPFLSYTETIHPCNNTASATLGRYKCIDRTLWPGYIYKATMFKWYSHIQGWGYPNAQVYDDRADEDKISYKWNMEFSTKKNNIYIDVISVSEANGCPLYEVYIYLANSFANRGWKCDLIAFYSFLIGWSPRRSLKCISFYKWHAGTHPKGTFANQSDRFFRIVIKFVSKAGSESISICSDPKCETSHFNIKIDACSTDFHYLTTEFIRFKALKYESSNKSVILVP